VEKNPYLEAIIQTLPRLLALFDRDLTSPSYGMGDRYYWAWGLIDFGNATFQGAAHGMARLWCAGLWPYHTESTLFIERINSIYEGAKRLTRADGSLEEAFPNEGSFCVTALVAFDLLCAADLLKGEVQQETRERWQTIIKPMINYLLIADETHALISNHLATAVAALVRWHKLTGDTCSERKAKKLLGRILENQSNEGWFKEYEGADPGYQSLCTYYLADVHNQRPDMKLREALRRSIQFLTHFAHPDGSFGGLYGSRCTRFYYPSGLEALSNEISEAAVLADYMATNISGGRVVALATMDEPNLVPMFNAYCWAATLWPNRGAVPPDISLPAMRGKNSRITFPEAGLWIDVGTSHYTIVNTNKGGVVVHFRDGKMTTLNAGVVVRNNKGRFGSTQSFSLENRVNLEGDVLMVESNITQMPKRLPTPVQFIFLRLLCVTVFRFRVLREWAKRWLVRLLITRRSRWPVRNIRRINLGPDITINDELFSPDGFTRIESPGAFVAIHMASQGYWQVQDELGNYDSAL
jgi:hypothetical protein